jgi:hypothetical protein
MIQAGIIRRHGAPIVLIVGLLFVTAAGHAAVPAPCPASVDAEKKFQQDCFDARVSMSQRAKVAQERYQNKMSHRAALIAGLKSELETRKQSVGIASQPPEEQPPETPVGDKPIPLVLLLVIGICGLLGIRWIWKVRALSASDSGQIASTQADISPPVAKYAKGTRLRATAVRLRVTLGCVFGVAWFALKRAIVFRR